MSGNPKLRWLLLVSILTSLFVVIILSISWADKISENVNSSINKEVMAEPQSRLGSNLGQKHNEPWYMGVLKVGIKTFMAWSVLLLPVILFIVWMSWPKKTNPQVDSAKVTSAGMEEGTKNLEGLGGWLILLGIGVVVSPFRIVAKVTTTLKEISESPGTESYTPFLKQFIMGEALVNLVIAMFGCLLIFLFFTKSKKFPKFYIGLLIFSVLVLLIDALVVKIVYPDLPFFLDSDGIREFVKTVIACLIWIPYMLVSKRVKATFTR